jgi:HD-like signal output (HDOD) protein
MTSITHDDIISAVQRLPSLPHIAMALIEALDNSEIDTHTLSQKISHDQALTAKILVLANSSFYGMPNKIGSISHAIAVLGFHSVRMLVMTTSIVDTFSGTRPSHFNYPQFWKHAIGTALCAHSIAHHHHANQDQAFIAGLLHNIGRIVLATCSPENYAKVLQWRVAHDVDLEQAENQLLGISHTRAGKVMLKHWQFPDSILDTLALPEQDYTSPQHTLAAIVHVADAIAYGLDLSAGQHDQVPYLSPLAWDALQLDDDVLDVIFETTERQFNEVCAIFGVPNP